MKTILKQISLAVALIAAIEGCNSKAETVQTDPPEKVAIQKIEPVQHAEQLSYSGTIEADNTVSIGFSVAGRVTSVLVMEGEHVNAGQLLATVETAELANALLISNASLQQSADNFKRLSELYSKNSLPERDYIAAKSSLEQAEANKNLAEKRLGDTKLYAPFSGIISAKLTEKGASAAPGVNAFTIMKTDQVYAQASVAESEIVKLSIGKEAIVNIPSLNDSLKGKITTINPQADATTKTFNVKVRLNNASGKILPGMLSNIIIYTGKPVQLLTIPIDAVVHDADGLTYVFVAMNNKAIRKRVDVGALTGNALVITDGVTAGDEIIVAGQTRLKDGQSITLQ